MIRRYKIFRVDPIYCKVNKTTREVIKDLFKFDKIYWKRVYGKKNKEAILKNQYMITGNKNTGGKFYFGSLPRVIRECKTKDCQVIFKELQKISDEVPVERNPILPTINFRIDQLKAIKATKQNYFGRIVAPTRSGKTIVQLGIASQFPSSCILLLAHTKDLITQLSSEAIKYSQNLPPVYTPENSYQITQVLKEIEPKNGLVICTIQSLSRVKTELFAHIFDIIMIDESHHVNKKNSMYGKLLHKIVTPRRYGFTATLPSNKEEELFNEGMLGDVIANLTVEKAIEKKIISKPKVELIPVQYQREINIESYSYVQYYSNGIVKNDHRNKLIAKIVNMSTVRKKPKPTLIIVERIEHGQNLKKYLSRYHNINAPFVKGQTSNGMRQSRLEKITSGKEPVTICSRIWMEGITMQNLEVIIYAAAMKEKKRVLQAMGRGLGKTSTKSTVTLYDFLDPYKYLAEHSISRIQTYVEEGWLNWI